MLKRGFTLIELLVVIAIIAILTAIIFPVFARVKDSAYRSSDMSNMNELGTALQLYRQDQGGYPPALLGYVTQYSDGGPDPTPSDMVPANALVGALYPKREASLATFQPSYDRIPSGQQYTMFTTAVWPNNTDAPSDPYAGAPQEFGPSDGNVQRAFVTDPNTPAQQCQDVPNYYYSLSGYDVATVPNESGVGKRNEIHYALFWSIYTVPTDPCNPTATQQGNAQDDPRQLGYYDPPATTIVTWDSNFRDYQDGVVQHTKKDIVLFLGSQTKAYDSANMDQYSWKSPAP